jgi:hypothetical protein
MSTGTSPRRSARFEAEHAIPEVTAPRTGPIGNRDQSGPGENIAAVLVAYHAEEL